MKRDYQDGKLDPDDWGEQRKELIDETNAASAQAGRLQAREAELAESLREATEDQVASELAELRAAIAGHVDGAEGLDQVRFRLRRLFDRFTLAERRGLPFLEAELAPGVFTTFNVERLARFVDAWRPEKTEAAAHVV